MFGTCEICGNEADLITVGEIAICQDCIEEGYVSCDRCQGYFPKEDTILYHLKDGSTLCEDCAIYAMNFSDLTEDDIDHIYEPEEEEYED